MPETGIDRYFRELETKEAQLAARIAIRAGEIKARTCADEINVLLSRLEVLHHKLYQKRLVFMAEIAPLHTEISDMEERIRVMKLSSKNTRGLYK